MKNKLDPFLELGPGPLVGTGSWSSSWNQHNKFQLRIGLGTATVI